MAQDAIIYQYNGYSLAAANRVIQENIRKDDDEDGPDGWKDYLCRQLEGKVKVTDLRIGKPVKPPRKDGFSCLWIPVHLTYDGGHDEQRRLWWYCQNCTDDESGFWCDACGLASEFAPELLASPRHRRKKK